jgi:hypothetical protein
MDELKVLSATVERFIKAIEITTIEERLAALEKAEKPRQDEPPKNAA